MRVAVITCYPDPDYIRAFTIREGLRAVPSVELFVIKNHSKGVKRYFEVIWQLLKVNWRHQPQLFVLTFRCYELLPFVLMIAGYRPVVLDELIDPILVVNEHRLQKTGIVHTLMGGWRLFGPLYYWLLRRCRYVISDTELHSAYALEHAKLKPGRSLVLPVGADEALFAPTPFKPQEVFTVFFYGSHMVRLHGLDYILQAAQTLSADASIRFHIIGGKSATEAKIQAAKNNGARITYEKRVPFAALADAMAAADVSIGGPLGLGEQANNVITGKTFQSIAMARPTIIGASPATLPYFKDKQNALVVSRGSSHELVDAIRWAKQHPDELQSLGQAGYQTYQANFSMKHITATLDTMIASLR